MAKLHPGRLARPEFMREDFLGSGFSVFLGALRDSNRMYAEESEAHCSVPVEISVRAAPRKFQDFDGLLCHVVGSD